MATVATAEVALLAKFPGVKSAIEQGLGQPISQAEKQTQTLGARFTQAFKSSFKTVGVVGGAAITGLGAAVAGIAMHGGISRALSIENAQAKLKGLGHDTKGVQAIMDSALASVKGTAYGLGDAATVAASLSATGLKAGGDLDSALKSVADVAQITGRSLTDVGAIFGSVAARGKLQGDDLLQLMSSGLPVLQMLGDHLGKTSEEVSEMVSRGEIDFATFQAAMEKGVGGAALAAGTTFTGAWANVKSALGRIGATLMTPILNALRDVFNAAIPVIDAIAQFLTPAFEYIGQVAADVAQKVVDFASSWVSSGQSATPQWLNVLVDSFKKLYEGIQNAATIIGPVLGGIGTLLGSALGAITPVVATVVAGIVEFVGAIMSSDTAMQILLVALGTAAAVFAGFKLGGLIADMVSLTVKLGAQATAWGLLTLAKAKDIAETVALNAMIAGDLVRNLTSSALGIARNTAAWIANAAALVAQKAVSVASTVATSAMTAAQWALNAALNANPIGLVVAAIVLLIAGLIAAWNYSETFRNVVMACWEGIKAAASVVAEWFTSTLVPAIGAVLDFLAGLWQSLLDSASNAWNSVKNAVSSAIQTVATVIQTTIAVISAVWSAAWSVISSFVSNAWNGIKTAVSAGVNLVKSVISSGISLVSSVWSSGWNRVSSFVSTAWGNIKSGVSSGISRMMSLITSIPGRITGAIGNLGSLLYDAGASVIRGFINGIKNMIGSVRDTLSGLTSMLPSWKGPAVVDARILYTSGELVMSGFKRGLEDQYANIRQSLGEFTRGMSLARGTADNPANVNTGWGRERGGDLTIVVKDPQRGVVMALRGEVEDSMRDLTGTRLTAALGV